MSARAPSMLGRLAEKFYYDFSLHKKYFPNTPYNKYVVLRHNFTIVGGFMFLLTAPFPFVPAFPTMGMCPPGWDGSFVCEPDKHKALDMYKAYREGRKYEEPAAGAAAHH
ncbi:F1F0 ATP synthase associated protein [Raphidocelis subcapitata]|uniref:F1F0 ATP synthase associated protein n=1 Tax=Raphidocelis subcapitata TaxID=307507 RepID=A0A2V0P238_9CHLO|nr:F1F0 ATP synthase associated protein [Raphidocelis subcapitata]|eukprot:GBF93936.1 F1F0 ATP synthase associated protein [Raphidocelis subcapitata]